MSVQFDSQDTTPWYKQFWPWFVIALPLSAVIAGLTTVYIANKDPDSIVKKDYYLAGVKINETMHLIENARRLGLLAQLTYSPDDHSLSILLTGPQQNIQNLQLVLRHPAYETLDRTIDLLPSTDQTYQAEFEFPMEGKWYATLTDNDKTWLIEAAILIDGTTSLTLSSERQ